MKKIIAISVMFALFAGAVFAEASLGFQFGFRIVAAENDTAKGSESVAGSANKNSHVSADFKNDDGTAGGRIRFYANPKQPWWNTGAPFAFAWWKPMDQIRVQFGHNPDGDWGGAQITGWGFNASAQDYVAIDNEDNDMGAWVGSADSGGFGNIYRYGEIWKTARSAGFYPGFGAVGATVSFYPMDGLSINIGVPIGSGDHSDGNTVKTYNVYPKSHLNIVYNLEGTGVLRVSFVGQGGLEKAHHDPEANQGASVGDLFASFYLTMIEGIGLDFGVGFGMPYTKSKTEAAGTTTTVKTNPDFQVGLGATYSGDGYGVKLRLGTTLAGSSTTSTDIAGGDSTSVTTKNATKIGVVILPYYALDICTVYFQVGLGMLMPEKGDSTTDWFINPYIKKSVSNLNFFAGLKVGSNGLKWNDGSTSIHWAVPFGFDCNF